MKKTSYLIATLLVVACNTKPKDYMLFSGTVANNNADYVYVTGHNMVDSLQISPSGTFKDTLKIAQPGYYTFRIGNETSTFYLENGESIDLSINTAEFDESITYKGEGAPENNYLASKYLANEKVILSNSRAYYSQTPENFIKKTDSLKQAFEKSLQSADVSDNFKKLEEKNLEYDKVAQLYNYQNYYPYFNSNQQFTPNAAFNEQLKGIDYDNEEDAKNYNSYGDIVMGDFNSKVMPYNNSDSLPQKSVELLMAKKSPAVQQIIMNQLGEQIKPGGDEKVIPYYFDVFYPLSTDEAYKEKLVTNYNLFKRLMNGSPSPTFTYENYEGGSTSLADFKGKYVYIDVWATWCGPCKAEIPYLQKVEEEFHSNNIAFVSISIDSQKDYEKWRKFVKEENLGGTQLFAPHEGDATFIDAYGVYYIPRFILVDPEGKIVTANAPRPSNPDLKDLFGSLENF